MGTLAIALACLAVGCPGPPAAEAPPPKPFSLSFEKSGGLKPMPEKLTIDPGRHAEATIAGTGAGTRTVRFRVSRKKVGILQKGFRRAGFPQLESPLPGNCADCFIYTIRYRGHEVTIDEAAMSAELRDVVTKLETIVFDHVISPAPEELPHRPFH